MERFICRIPAKGKMGKSEKALLDYYIGEIKELPEVKKVTCETGYHKVDLREPFYLILETWREPILGISLNYWDKGSPRGSPIYEFNLSNGEGRFLGYLLYLQEKRRYIERVVQLENGRKVKVSGLTPFPRWREIKRLTRSILKDKDMGYRTRAFLRKLEWDGIETKQTPDKVVAIIISLLEHPWKSNREALLRTLFLLPEMFKSKERRIEAAKYFIQETGMRPQLLKEDDNELTTWLFTRVLEIVQRVVSFYHDRKASDEQKEVIESWKAAIEERLTERLIDDKILQYSKEKSRGKTMKNYLCMVAERLLIDELDKRSKEQVGIPTEVEDTDSELSAETILSIEKLFSPEDRKDIIKIMERCNNLGRRPTPEEAPEWEPKRIEYLLKCLDEKEELIREMLKP